ncbi:tyrosinase-like [Xenia sp. Carnegie-2017]|uniref:tyrosinase-like n=1 Tax=Xenia sp. Carnegie-2017 TaxID=2897299 RepID=UPI001F03EFEC|nr:tyrosinase-like [Xenia sp. Carnegie-2017]
MSTKRSFLYLLIVSVLSAQHLLVNAYAKRYRSDLRIRKEFTSMSYHERRKFVDAYKIASTQQPFKRRYDYLVRLHQTLFKKVHSQKHFFPWHRWYLLQFENLFRYIHKDVTLPYWDWSIAGERIWATDTGSIWSKKSWGLGGNGKGLFHCVKDGPFSVYKWRLARHSGGGCLKRNFKGRMPNCRHVQRTLLLKPTQFKRFEDIVQDTYHNELHCCIRGTMELEKQVTRQNFFYTTRLLIKYGMIGKRMEYDTNGR